MWPIILQMFYESVIVIIQYQVISYQSAAFKLSFLSFTCISAIDNKKYPAVSPILTVYEQNVQWLLVHYIYTFIDCFLMGSNSSTVVSTQCEQSHFLIYLFWGFMGIFRIISFFKPSTLSTLWFASTLSTYWICRIKCCAVYYG